MHQISYEILSTFSKSIPILLSKLHSKRSDEHLRDFILPQNFLFLLVGIRCVSFLIFSQNVLIILSKARSSCIEEFFGQFFPEKMCIFFPVFGLWSKILLISDRYFCYVINTALNVSRGGVREIVFGKKSSYLIFIVVWAKAFRRSWRNYRQVCQMCILNAQRDFLGNSFAEQT